MTFCLLLDISWSFCPYPLAMTDKMHSFIHSFIPCFHRGELSACVLTAALTSCTLISQRTTGVPPHQPQTPVRRGQVRLPRPAVLHTHAHVDPRHQREAGEHPRPHEAVTLQRVFSRSRSCVSVLSSPGKGGSSPGVLHSPTRPPRAAAGHFSALREREAPTFFTWFR